MIGFFGIAAVGLATHMSRRRGMLAGAPEFDRDLDTAERALTHGEYEVARQILTAAASEGQSFSLSKSQSQRWGALAAKYRKAAS